MHFIIFKYFMRRYKKKRVDMKNTHKDMRRAGIVYIAVSLS